MPLPASRAGSSTLLEGINISPASKVVRLSGDYGTHKFVMRRGGFLPEVHIAYETWGELSRNKDNAILVFTGLSPSAHACSSAEDPNPGWWEYMIGPGKPIDTNYFFVICVNSLGSCYGSTYPMSINPDTKKPYGISFPDLTIEDIAKAAHHAINDIGIDHLHTVVGGSMGGMSALAYALQYPKEVNYLISISAACRALPFTIATRSLQREIIRCDPCWKGGYYSIKEEPCHGMILARKLALMSYRAAEEWHQRFNRARIDLDRRDAEPFAMEFEVESYLDYNAKKFAKRFDANSYLYLSRALDWFDAVDHGGSVNAGLAKVHVRKALVIGVTSDILFPVQQQHEMAEGLKKSGNEVVYHELASIYGHDSFLIDHEMFSPVVRTFLESTLRNQA